MCAGAWSPEEDVRVLGPGVTGSGESPTVGAGNETWVLFKSSKHP